MSYLDMSEEEIHNLVERGFHVKLVSDQREGDYYSVTYPPQSR